MKPPLRRIFDSTALKISDYLKLDFETLKSNKGVTDVPPAATSGYSDQSANFSNFDFRSFALLASLRSARFRKI